MGMDSEQRENMAKATMDSLNKIPSALKGKERVNLEKDLLEILDLVTNFIADDWRYRSLSTKERPYKCWSCGDTNDHTLTCMYSKVMTQAAQFVGDLSYMKRSEYEEKKNKDTEQLKPFPVLGREIGELLEEKRKHYGQSFYRAGDFLKLLYPNGLPLEEYDNALALIRIFDKMNRIASPNKDTDKENPWKDMAGYAMLGTRLWKKTTTSCDQQDQHRKGMTCSKCGEYTC